MCVAAAEDGSRDSRLDAYVPQGAYQRVHGCRGGCPEHALPPVNPKVVPTYRLLHNISHTIVSLTKIHTNA